jgi:MipA family protein
MGVPLPVVSIVTPSGFTFDTTQGIGFQHLFADRVFIQSVITYDGGRKDHNDGIQSGSDELRGMGDIKGVALANLYVAYQFTPRISIGVGTSQPLTDRARGFTYQGRFDATVLELPKDRVTISGSANFGNASYNQTFYGVTAEQSANSGFLQYKAGSGLYALKSSVTYVHQVDKNWSVIASVALTRFTSKAADSPIVKSNFNYAAVGAVKFSF